MASPSRIRIHLTDCEERENFKNQDKKCQDIFEKKQTHNYINKTEINFEEHQRKNISNKAHLVLHKITEKYPHGATLTNKTTFIN